MAISIVSGCFQAGDDAGDEIAATDTTGDTTDDTTTDDTTTDDTTDDATTDDTTTDDTTTGGDSFVFAEDPPDAYSRVDRMGMPAIATAVITSKDDYNASNPSDDVMAAFVNEITANLNGLHAALDDDLSDAGFIPCQVVVCVNQAAPLVVPDTLQIDLSSPAGFPNGRMLTDPVIDITLAAVMLELSTPSDVLTFANLPLNPPLNDVEFLADFPYLAPPN
jgi:hypothetical protein